MRRLPALALLLAGLAAGPGCGSSDRTEVTETVKAFRTATADRDYARICKDILAKNVVSRLNALGLPCEQALSKYLVETRKPKITIDRVRVKGKTATAFTTSSAEGQPETRATVRLVKEDGSWRIASLGGP